MRWSFISFFFCKTVLIHLCLLCCWKIPEHLQGPLLFATCSQTEQSWENPEIERRHSWSDLTKAISYTIICHVQQQKFKAGGRQGRHLFWCLSSQLAVMCAQALLSREWLDIWLPMASSKQIPVLHASTAFASFNLIHELTHLFSIVPWFCRFVGAQLFARVNPLHFPCKVGTDNMHFNKSKL